MKTFAYSILTLALLSGCTKIVDIDLNNSTPKLVIEGIITDDSPAQVTINQSVQFSSSNSFPAKTGAVVSVSDNTGSTFILQESNPGVYTNGNLVGVSGRTYNLNVSVDGATYQSSSTMPGRVNMDTILLEKIAFIPDGIWIVKPKYVDPAGFGDYYKFNVKINNVKNPTIWVWDDKLSNNGVSTRPLIQADSIIKIGDTIEVDMQCIDRNIFRYFTALQNLQQNATTPANPDTNISGNVLGYFSAHTSQRKRVVVR